MRPSPFKSIPPARFHASFNPSPLLLGHPDEHDGFGPRQGSIGLTNRVWLLTDDPATAIATALLSNQRDFRWFDMSATTLPQLTILSTSPSRSRRGDNRAAPHRIA